MKTESTHRNSCARILIVEDSATQAEKLKHILEEKRYHVDVVANGKEALGFLKKSIPALIISDILMPHINGYEMCREIKGDEKLKDIPVILLTSLSDPDDIIHGLECGADNFVVKPYDENYLLTRINHLLTNMELRKSDKVQMGVSIHFAGRNHVINSDRRQVLDLLISTFESAVQQNHELKKAKEELKSMNEHLEEKVAERTAALEDALSTLAEAQQRIVQQERLHALGQMASGIAHDFNNALSPIIGFSELLLISGALGDGEKTKHYLEMINMSAHDAAEIVKRLREFYRPRDENEEHYPANLKSVIEQVIAITQPKWKNQPLARGITIRIETDFQVVPEMSCDEHEMREMFTNLIFNAVDAMPQGGIIGIQTRMEKDDLIVEVSDTGVGMTEEIRKRCFEPFYSTKGSEGTGLGLSMVYGIAQRHGGILEIESEPEKGTTVRLRCPQKTGEPSETDENKRQTAEYIPRHLRVLVTDDEPAVCMVIAEYLSVDGHVVETACDGKDALEKFFAGYFDLVISDRSMPQISGDQLALAVKKEKPKTPFILLTGFGDLMNAADESPEGVDIIVSKPVTRQALRDAILKVVSG